MLVKVITFFLIGMAVLAMFGRLRFPRPKTGLPPKPRKCPDCGAYLIGKGPCRCKGG
jgi:hypothetical protein